LRGLAPKGYLSPRSSGGGGEGSKAFVLSQTERCGSAPDQERSGQMGALQSMYL